MVVLVLVVVNEKDAVADDVAECVFDGLVLDLGFGGEEGAKAGDLVFHSYLECYHFRQSLMTNRICPLIPQP